MVDMNISMYFLFYYMCKSAEKVGVKCRRDFNKRDINPTYIVF